MFFVIGSLALRGPKIQKMTFFWKNVIFDVFRPRDYRETLRRSRKCRVDKFSAKMDGYGPLLCQNYSTPPQPSQVSNKLSKKIDNCIYLFQFFSLFSNLFQNLIVNLIVFLLSLMVSCFCRFIIFVCHSLWEGCDGFDALSPLLSKKPSDQWMAGTSRDGPYPMPKVGRKQKNCTLLSKVCVCTHFFEFKISNGIHTIFST